MTSDLAEEIRAAVAEASPAARPAPAAAAGPEEIEDIRLPLTRAMRYLTPAIPPGVRFSPAKRLLLRVFKFLWRDQASFNALLIEAGRGFADRIDAARAHLDVERGSRERQLAALGDQLAAFKQVLERELDAGHRRAAIQDGRLLMLEAGSPGAAAPPSPQAPAPSLPHGVYALFEERFRGSPEEVTSKQRSYLPLLRGLPGPVLDVGCGRGELLRLLAAEGIPASGVELNPIAVRACREDGLAVEEADGLSALSGKQAGSLGGVVALQVVEHWSAETTFDFLRQARRALAPGGVLIAETVNTDSLSALKAFFLDPSHVRPVPADALRFLAEAAGFAETRIEHKAPLAPEERLEESSPNDAKLNRLLFGPQDYALIARVPDGAEDARRRT